MPDESNAQNPSLVVIITKPAQQFDRIREKPLVGFPIIMTMVLFAAGLLIGNTDEAFTIDTGSAIIIGVIIEIILRVFTLSALFMFFTSFAPNSTVTLKQLGSMNSYISFVFAIGMLMMGVTVFIMEENPAIWFADMITIIHLIFSIWMIILTALGLEKVAAFPGKLAWPVAIVFILALFFDYLGILILILVLAALIKFGLTFTKPKNN